MNISFFIRDRSKETTTVYCSVKLDGSDRIIIKVPNSKIKGSDWEDGWIKTGRGFQDNSKFESYLNEFKKQLEIFAREYYSFNSVNPSKSEIERYLNSQQSIEEYFAKNKVFDLMPVLRQLVADRHSGVELNDGKKFSDGTVRDNRASVVALEEYSKHTNLKVTNLSVVSEGFITGFRQYLTYDRDLQLNTVSNRLKTIKALLDVIRRRGVIPFNPFERYNIAIKWEPANGIALEDNEIEELTKLDLQDDPRLDRVRDLFLVLIFTGLRVSDLKSLQHFQIDDDIITIHNQKTGGISHIPVFPQLKTIIDKYSGTIPDLISEQKFRTYLKEVGLLVKTLKKKVQIQYTKGGKVCREMKPRNELLCLHVGRRTLATYLAKRGVPYHEIMIITGHKSVRDFENYIRVDKKSTLKNLIQRVKTNNFNYQTT